jgi:hypothetical protein
LSISNRAIVTIPLQNTSTFEKDSLTNTKRTRNSFVLLRNIDVEVIHLMLEISFSRRNFRDLTDLLKGLHNLNDGNSNNNSNINRNNTTNNTTNDDRFLNVFHLLTIIIDTTNILYSYDFRKKFLNTITDNMNISTYFSDLKSLSPALQKSRNNNKITDLILGHISTLTNEVYYKSVQNSLLNCVKKVFVFLRGEIQREKWREVLYQLNFSDNDNNDNNDEIINPKKFFPIEKGFMIISDLNNIENGGFCDRLYISEKIDRIVFLIWRKLGVVASDDNRLYNKEDQREMVALMDRYWPFISYHYGYLFVLMPFWLFYMEIHGMDFLTPSFVIYISKHHHHV